MPKLVDKEAKRREMALNVVDLFARKGFEKSSIREITEVLGIGKGSFYDYYKDKHDLLEEMAGMIFSTWNDHFEKKISRGNSAIEQLRILILEGAASVILFEKFMMIYMDIWRFSVGNGPYSRFQKVFKNYLHQTGSVVAEIVERGKIEGSIRDDVNSAALATAVIAFIDGLCLHSMVFASSLDSESVASAFFAFLSQGVIEK